MWATRTPTPGDLQDQQERLPREAQAPRLLLRPAPAVSPGGAQGRLSDLRPRPGNFRPEVWEPVSQLLALKVGVVSCWMRVPFRLQTGSVVPQEGGLGGVTVTSVQACPHPTWPALPLGVQCRSEEFFQCRCRAWCPGRR